MYIFKENQTMDLQSLAYRLRGIFSNRRKTQLEQYIESKHPKTGADVEHWLQQWTYNNHKDYLGL